MTTAEAIILFVCVFVAVSLMIAGSIRNNPFWAIGAFPAWILFSALGFMTSTATWDFYYFMGWIGIMMFFGCALEAILVRPKKVKQEPEFSVRPTSFKSHMDNSNRKRESKDPYRVLRSKRIRAREHDAVSRIASKNR